MASLEAEQKADALQALAEQANAAKEAVNDAIIDVAEKIMADTGADWDTALAQAEETVAEVFDQAVRDVTEQVASET